MDFCNFVLFFFSFENQQQVKRTPVGEIQYRSQRRNGKKMLFQTSSPYERYLPSTCKAGSEPLRIESENAKCDLLKAKAKKRDLEHQRALTKECFDE